MPMKKESYALMPDIKQNSFKMFFMCLILPTDLNSLEHTTSLFFFPTLNVENKEMWKDIQSIVL